MKLEFIVIYESIACMLADYMLDLHHGSARFLLSTFDQFALHHALEIKRRREVPLSMHLQRDISNDCFDIVTRLFRVPNGILLLQLVDLTFDFSFQYKRHIHQLSNEDSKLLFQ